MRHARGPVSSMARHVAHALVRSAEFVVTIALVFVMLPIWLFPRRSAVTLGRIYGRIVGACWPAARRVAMINLRRAYGRTMTRAIARRWTLQIFGHLGASVAEGLQAARRIGQRPDGWESAYEPEDPALERRIIEDPRPKIFVTGHLGSWEVAAILAGRRVGPTGAVIARHIDNPFLNAIVRYIRWGRGSQWVDKRGATVEAMARLERGHSVAMLLDENAGRRGIFVDVMGRQASTSKMAALLSLRTGAPIVVGAAIHRPAGARPLFRLALVEPDPLAADPVRALTQRIASIWDAWVRDTPLQWRWVHWRWRRRPDGSEETYTRRDLRDCFDADMDPVQPIPCGFAERTR